MNKWELPIKTEWMKSQMKHEPSRKYSEEIFNLVKKNPYENALEVGAAWGLSTLAILLAGEGNLTSVDKDDPKYGGIKAPEEVKVNELEHRWKFILEDSRNFWEKNEDKIGTYDLIYIDGSHIYEDVYNDLCQGWRYLKKGGLLLLDDFTHKNNKTGMYGVSLAAWLLVAEQRITEVRTTPRILYFRK